MTPSLPLTSQLLWWFGGDWGVKALIDSFSCSQGLEPIELQGIRTGGGPCLTLRKGLNDVLPSFFFALGWKDSNFIFAGLPNGLYPCISPVFSSSVEPQEYLRQVFFLTVVCEALVLCHGSIQVFQVYSSFYIPGWASGHPKICRSFLLHFFLFFANQ